MGYLGYQGTFTGTQNNKRVSVSANSGQVDFLPSGGYNINAIDVYRNGVKLVGQRDFVALDGLTVTLTQAANSGDIIEFVIYENFVVADVLNGDGDQTVRGNFTVTGDFTAGGTLNATVASTLKAGIATEAIRAGMSTEATRAGIATEAVRAGIASVAVSAGIATVATAANTLSTGATGTGLNVTGIITATQFSGNITGTAATITGDVTVGGNVSIAGTLTYEDVTNVDSIGLITARDGLQVLSGITTISGQTDLSNTTISGVTTITNVVIPNETRFSNVAEKMVRVSASSSIGVCTYTSTANIIYFDAPSADVVIRVEGIPENSAFDNHSITVSAILRTTGTGRSCHPFVRLNGVERPVKFAGGSRNEATSGVTTTNGYTVYNFVGVNTIGSASSAANYEVFGVVSGGFF